MKIEPKAFIAIERSMAGAMQAQLDALSSSIVAQLHAAVADKDWAKAQEIANKLTLAGVVQKVRPRLEELAVSALLFGAHRVTGDVRRTAFMQGDKVPAELQGALTQLEHTVEHDASDYVRKAVHAKIEALKRQDETSHMQKHDVYLEPDKRPNAQATEDYDPDADKDVDGETARRQEALLGRAGWQQKDEISDAQLAETGGLLEPEQAEAAPKKKKRKPWVTKTEGPKTLYVSRPLLNAVQLIAWARGQGFNFVQAPEDMHVTIVYSKEPFDWDDIDPKFDDVTVVNGQRTLKQFGTAVVLIFASPALDAEHEALMAAGASHSYDGYHSHVTITWEGAPRDLADIEPYEGPLVFGPQVFKPINKDWQLDHQEMELRKAEAKAKSLVEQLNDCVRNGGKVASDTGAALTTSRLVTLGFLSQARKSGRTAYRVDEVLDDRTCPVCEIMNGKTFDVDQQFGRAIQQLSASDPQDLKSRAPWPDLADVEGVSNDALQAGGYGAPPYHAGCRGMLSIVEEAEEPEAAEEEVAQPETAEPDETGDELTQLQIPAEGEVLQGWTDDAIAQLGWDRFNVTDPEAFKAVDDAYAAGNYDEAEDLLDEWRKSHTVGKADAEPPGDEGFEGPNAGKKKRKLQSPAGREQDYDDIRSDSSSIAFDSGVMNDANSPIDGV